MMPFTLDKPIHFSSRRPPRHATYHIIDMRIRKVTGHALLTTKRYETKPETEHRHEH